MDKKQKLGDLRETKKKIWSSLLEHSPVLQSLTRGQLDLDFYRMYLIETCHYTSYNAKNQALVATRKDNLDVHYQKFCLHHAQEEVGHDLMAWHDLQTLGGAWQREFLPRPLAATEALIAYLYWISENGNPLQRLGYSFWAEDSYEYLSPLIEALQKQANLKDSQLTFFKAHHNIDQHHIEEVEQIVLKCAKDHNDWQDIEFVMQATLKLTGLMVDEVFQEYSKMKAGEKFHYQKAFERAQLL